MVGGDTVVGGAVVESNVLEVVVRRIEVSVSERRR